MGKKEKELVDICLEFCTGCGLCGAVLKKNFLEDERHFCYPNLTENDFEFCKQVCPAAGNAVNNYSNGEIWGNVISSYLGWSNDTDIRYRASSGGTITSLCLYLLEKHIVDAIIQVKKDDHDPRRTVTAVNTKPEEILQCMGSRYTTSAPLLDITSKIESEKKYAFVGKPCDVSALRMLQVSASQPWTKQIVFMFSFFCAGQPSLAANDKLLAALGCKSVNDCEEFSYRGDGWPGQARVFMKDKTSNSMDYEQSWMKILGRDVRKCCRFCADGTGEMADISCGDAWYLSPSGKPDFAEHPGRNVIFSRTSKGDWLLNELIKHDVISVEKYDNKSYNLQKSQPYHYNRKASLSSLKLAMNLCRRRFPLYGKSRLKNFAKGFPLRSRIYRCVGTIERVRRKII